MQETEKNFRQSLVSRILMGICGALLIGLCFGIFVPTPAHAATNISSNVAQHWAWADLIGWIDFYNTNTVIVGAHGLNGYASSSAGYFSLDCSTSPIGNICGASNYQVLNDGAGNLSGWGWNDSYGWISFCGGQGTFNCPGSITYQTSIDSNGNFQGYAWNDTMGWIDFNCDNVGGGCSVSNYEVSTSWMSTSTTGYLDSATYDTSSTGGAQINSLIWYGSMPAGTAVGFQFAVSNSSSGPWNYEGSDGTASTTYSVAPSTPITLSYSLFSGFRYFRYRTILTSNTTQTVTPRVDEVIVNWSP